MDIIAVIRELLFRHDCVVLPGFGGFIGNYSSARTDRSTNTFYPPVKLISFNRNLNHNDGLLTATVSARAGLKFNEAANLVEEFISDIKRRLNRGEKVIFEGIGSFTVNSEGNYLFEPDRTINYNLNSYGLSSFTFPPPEGLTHIRKIHSTDNAEISSFNYRKYIWRAAVIVPILGTLIAVPVFTGVFKTRVQTTSLNPVTAIVTDSGFGIRKPLSEESAESLRAAVKVTDENAKSSDVSNVVVDALKSDEVWYVITGSFKSSANAHLLAKKLSDEGYSPQISNGPNGFFRVNAVICSTLEEAMKFKNELISKYPGTWVKKEDKE